MITTLQRHVLLETLKVFALTLTVALVIMTLGGGFKEGDSKGLSPFLILRIVPYLIPEMLRYTLPGCLLFAVCSVYGGMAASNEVVALKSVGVDPRKVIWPVLVLAYILSVAAYGMYELCAAWSRPGLRQVIAESIDDIAYGMLRSSGTFQARGISITAMKVRDRRIYDLTVVVSPRNDRPEVTLTAQEAELRTAGDGKALQVACRNGKVEFAGMGSFIFQDRYVHQIPLPEDKGKLEDRISPAGLRTAAFGRQIDREKSLIRSLQRTLEDPPGDEQRTPDQIRSEIKGHQVRLYRLQAETSRRMANGLACLCFAMIGAPVALWFRSSDMMSVFFFCFAPILLVYYPLMVTGEALAKAGVYPAVTVWLADAVLLVVGVWLLARVSRQ